MKTSILLKSKPEAPKSDETSTSSPSEIVPVRTLSNLTLSDDPRLIVTAPVDELDMFIPGPPTR